MIRVLNLYAGIGGNRKLWKDVKVTAVEIDREIADIYKRNFQDDEVIIADAHEFLLEHFREYDFIWSSPPCPTHSRARWWRYSKEKPVYIDMRLWQEIIFLQYHAKNKWVVENVISYYDPLIKPSVTLGRHYFWSNFYILGKNFDINYTRMKDCLKCMEEEYGIDVGGLKGKRKRTVLRNVVHPEIGKYVFDCAFNQKKMGV